MWFNHGKEKSCVDSRQKNCRQEGCREEDDSAEVGCKEEDDQYKTIQEAKGSTQLQLLPDLHREVGASQRELLLRIA
jgi:hypothetical protein